MQLLRGMRVKRCMETKTTNFKDGLDSTQQTALRSRSGYLRKGYSSRWADKRLGGVSARQELTGEWYKRGVGRSETFRELTNLLMQSVFGMDVETFRRSKGLTGTRERLRDHLNDIELAVLTLAETVAVHLHRSRGSIGVEALVQDVGEAAQIAGSVLTAIDERSPRPAPVPVPQRDQDAPAAHRAVA